jgi:hypothetical protein
LNPRILTLALALSPLVVLAQSNTQLLFSPPGTPAAVAPAGAPGIPGAPQDPAQPSLPGQPAAPWAGASAPLPPLPSKPVIPEIEETVPAARIGKVNGQYIYRGVDTYVFEPTRARKVTRTPSTPAMLAAAAAVEPLQPHAALPGAVGGPSPQAAPLPNAARARATAPAK